MLVVDHLVSVSLRVLSATGYIGALDVLMNFVLPPLRTVIPRICSEPLLFSFLLSIGNHTELYLLLNVLTCATLGMCDYIFSYTTTMQIGLDKGSNGKSIEFGEQVCS